MRLTLATLALAALCTATSAAANPAFTGLSGRWVGSGTLVTGDATESMKCIATFIKGGSDTEMTATVRCASTGYTFEIRCELKSAGTALTGSWHERKYESRGSLSGTARDGSISARVTGENVRARLDIARTGNNQKVTIVPHDSTVRSITISMQRG